MLTLAGLGVGLSRPKAKQKAKTSVSATTSSNNATTTSTQPILIEPMCADNPQMLIPSPPPMLPGSNLTTPRGDDKAVSYSRDDQPQGLQVIVPLDTSTLAKPADAMSPKSYMAPPAVKYLGHLKC